LRTICRHAVKVFVSSELLHSIIIAVNHQSHYRGLNGKTPENPIFFPTPQAFQWDFFYTISCGAAIQAIVVNGLGFTRRALYLMPHYLTNKPIDLLVAPDLPAEDFNDDNLGPSLDRRFEAGVIEVFAPVARRAQLHSSLLTMLVDDYAYSEVAIEVGRIA